MAKDFHRNTIAPAFPFFNTALKNPDNWDHRSRRNLHDVLSFISSLNSSSYSWYYQEKLSRHKNASWNKTKNTKIFESHSALWRCNRLLICLKPNISDRARLSLQFGSSKLSSAFICDGKLDIWNKYFKHL